MRSALFAVLFGSMVLAQPPASREPTEQRLDEVLAQWQQRVSAASSIDCQFSREDKSKITGFVEKRGGTIRFLKPHLGSMEFQDGESYLLNGRLLYEYQPRSKSLYIRELPADVANVKNPLMSLLMGVGVQELKRRFDVTLTKDVSAENKHYIYIEIRPRLEEWKRQFSRAQLVLFHETMLPRRFWIEHPNGDSTTWHIDKISTTAGLKPEDFTPKPVPSDWRTIRVPLDDAGGKTDATPGSPRISPGRE